jgi:hypothetical protein
MLRLDRSTNAMQRFAHLKRERSEADCFKVEIRTEKAGTVKSSRLYCKHIVAVLAVYAEMRKSSSRKGRTGLAFVTSLS